MLGSVQLRVNRSAPGIIPLLVFTFLPSRCFLRLRIPPRIGRHVRALGVVHRV